MTVEGQELLALTERFVSERIAPRALEIDQDDVFPWDILKAYSDLGYLSMMVPEEHGGAAADLQTLCQIIEIIASVSPAAATILLGHTTAVIALLMAAPPAILARTLFCEPDPPRFLAIGITEPDAGSDVQAVRTKAIQTDKGWILNGHKRFVTNGEAAQAYLILARTGKLSERPRHLSLFLVEREAKGLGIGRAERKIGLHGSSTTDVILDDVRLGADSLVGEIGGGFATIMNTLERTRVVVAMIGVGIAHGALDAAVSYARKREAFGRPIGAFQGLQFLLADMATRVEAARSLTQQAIRRITKGSDDATATAAMAKMFATDMALMVAADAVQVLGGYGCIEDYGVERFLRDAKITQVYEGTNQIQRLIVAQSLLGHL